MAERGGLENRYTFTGIGGSNPPLSAKSRQKDEGRRQKDEEFARLLPSPNQGRRMKAEVHKTISALCLLPSAF